MTHGYETDNDGFACILDAPRRPFVPCGRCKHWDATEGYSPPGFGQCALISDSEYDEAALARTAHGYDLFTRPTFGCVMGEGKGATEGSETP